MKQIFFTSDILMTKESEQFSNLRWFRDILTRRILKATGLTPISTTSSIVNPEQLNRDNFFSLSEIKVDIDDVQFYYDDNKISDCSIEYLNEFIPAGSIVIAYELSKQTRNVFERAGITYVDIWLHPIRYLDDILFAFNSNSSQVHNKIKAYNLDEEHFYLYADKFKIGTYKGFKRLELKLEPNSALFVGQTLNDKAICKNGDMLNLLDFKDKFNILSSKYNKVYYSRHPFVGSGDKKVLDWLKSIDNVEVVEHSAYHLLSSNNIKGVFTISSSVAHEAKYFGKKVEFWHEPIFYLDTKYSFNNYISIYQDFISPCFWSDILSPILETEECEDVSFLSKKDKLRDMLGFYYSYKHVDKSEQIRQSLLAVDRRVQRIDKEISNPLINKISNNTGKYQEDYNLIEDERLLLARKLIDKAEVVSFDIFDTLIQRKVAEPNDIFYLMDEFALSIGVSGFPTLRQKSRGYVKKENEEVPLVDRYMALVERGDLTLEQGRTLLKFELDLEIEICEERIVGVDLLHYALKKKKRVVLISDIFFSQEFVETLLRNTKITKYEKLYVSSEVGLLKHTGNLFPFVSKDMSIAPEKFIHFGDNHHADGDMAIKSGFKSFILPSNKVISEKVSYYTGPLGFDNPYVESVTQGLVNNKLTSGMFGKYSRGLYQSNYDTFGYCTMGPIFAAFAAWLLKKAKADGVEKLYFLARDGEIIKRCYDELASIDKKAPKSEYLLCSRRAVNIPKMQTINDIMEVASVNFSSVKLKNIMKNRFGIDARKFSKQSLLECDFQSIDDIVKFNDDLERFKKLLSLESDCILQSASEERAELMKYFDSKGLLDNKQYSVVDIGHNGSMQKSLSQLLKKPNLGGYYFMTFEGAKNTLGTSNLLYSSFLGHNANPKNEGMTYFKYILMFEMLFLNTSGSFIRFKNSHKISLPLTLESKRVEFIEKAHNGCVRFVNDWIKTLGESAIESNVLPAKVIIPYVKLLESPRYLDAKMFEGICFENVYSARDNKYLCRLGGNTSDSVWKEGQIALNKNQAESGSLKRTFDLVFFILNKLSFLSDKKYKKYKNNPQAFFNDSKFR